jgi:tetratricopeptide (TPR) repeat protein
MRLQILLATVALISTFCSACSESRSCTASALADIAVSYSIAQQNDQALKVVQQIKNLTRRADVLSQIALQSAKAGQTEQATALFTQALQVANKIESPPDKAMALEAIATQYGRVGQKDKAAEVLSQAVQEAKAIWGTSFVKDTVLEKIAVNYAQLGDYEQAIQLADTIVEDIPKGRALARIVAQYVEAGQYNQARQVANTIEVQTSKANALIEIAAKTGEYQPALSVAQKIDEEESALAKSMILGKLALLFSKVGQEKQADEVLSKALDAARNIEDKDTQAWELNRIAILYLELGKKEQAVKVSAKTLAVANQFPDVDKKAKIYAGVAVVYGKAGERDLATSVLTQAVQMCETIQNKETKAQTLAEIAIASAKIHPYEQVLQLIQQTLGNVNTQAYALTRIAKDYEEAGDKEQAAKALEQAFQIAQTRNSTKDKSQILANIAVQLGKIAQYDRAIAIAQTLDATQRDSPKAFALAKIANYYAKAGQKEKAIALLSQALQVANTTQCSD